MSHAFDMGDWAPEQKAQVAASTVYLARASAILRLNAAIAGETPTIQVGVFPCLPVSLSYAAAARALERDTRLSQRLTLLLISILTAGCATLPEVHPWFNSTEPRATPTVVGARGPLAPAQTAAVLARLQARGGDLLARHIAIEEEVAGTPLVIGNQATLLRDGPEFYTAMFEAIERARDHVHVEFYIIEDDEVGRRFSDALIRKAKQGVAVNLLYDSVGSSETPSSFFQRLRDAALRCSNTTRSIR